MEPTNIMTHNPSHDLKGPAHLNSDPTITNNTSSDTPVNMAPNQDLSALHVKQPTNVDVNAKGTLQNIGSLADTAGTTMGDSAINIPSQNISQPGTLNAIDNQPNIDLNRGSLGLGADSPMNEALTTNSGENHDDSTKSAFSKKIKRTESVSSTTEMMHDRKENVDRGLAKGNEAVEPVTIGQDQISALSNQETLATENARQLEKIQSPDVKKLERETSLEKLANQAKQNEKDALNKTPAQLKFDTDQSESFGTPNQKELDSTPVPYKIAGSDQQFTSDQPDSEGYSSRQRAGSSRAESGLSSTEDNKTQETVKKEPAVVKHKISLADFHKVAVLGRGSYGEVSLVKKTSNNKLYALKAIDKFFMKKEKKEHQVYVEKEVLMKSNHPNIIKFYSSFQDKKKLYFVLEYVGGGEFSDYLRAQRKLRKEEVAFFTAEVINILEYLHSNKIAHRDIKPENLLLTIDGHLKCIDFGTARFMAEPSKNEPQQPEVKPENVEENAAPRKDSEEPLSHRKTFVGTAQYVSPEMLEHSECDAAGDLWALGCMIYVMAVGRYPFEESNEFLIFQKIQNLDITYPLDLDPEIKDLIEKLLKKDPYERLGSGEKGTPNDFGALKAHSLFTGIDFSTLHKKKAPMAEIVSPHRQKDQYTSFPSPGGDDDSIRKLVPNRKHFLSEDLQTLEERAGKIPAQPATTTEVKDRVILSGLVLKKCGWLFYRPRQLVLNNKPRLVYYDPETSQLKDEILLEPGTIAELESKSKWIIHTPKKKYYFKEMEHSAEKWVETINKVVAQFSQKKV